MSYIYSNPGSYGGLGSYYGFGGPDFIEKLRSVTRNPSMSVRSAGPSISKEQAAARERARKERAAEKAAERAAERAAEQ